MTTFYGHFTRYYPVNTGGAQYWHSEDGLDFYTLTRGMSQHDTFGNFLSTATGEMFIAVRDGVIQSAGLDISRLVPNDCDVYGIDPRSVTEEPQFGDLWIDGKVTAPPVDNSPPKRVTMRQARAVLIDAGLDDDVETALAAMTGIEGKQARNEWEYGSDVFRDSDLVTALGSALGLSGTAIDDMFRTAATL